MAFAEYNSGHLTGQPKAEDIALREPIAYRDLADRVPGATLSADEIGHFKARGFLVKRRLVDDDEALAMAVDHLWNNVPRGLLRRDDPTSWLNAGGEWPEEDVARVGRLRQGSWKMRSPGPAGIGTEAFLVDRIANHPAMLRLGGALLGGAVRPAKRVRGVYAVLPKPPEAVGALAPHADYMAAELSAMVLVDHVPRRCGGFTVWPGSHLRLHPHWDTVHGGRMSAQRGEGFRSARDAALRELSPVEISGAPGDAVIWHPRLLHSAGVNHSAENGREGKPRVRLVVPCDYQRAGRTTFDDDEFGPGEKYQWWVDTRNFREDVAATADNIWTGWAI